MNWGSLKKPAFLVALCVLALSALGMGAAVKFLHFSLVHYAIYPEDGRLLTSVPKDTEHWLCPHQDIPIEKDVEETLGTHNYFTRDYHLKKNEKIVIQLHAAYYTGMIDTVPHVSDRCFVAAGMDLDSFTQDIVLPLDKHTLIPDQFLDEPMRTHYLTARDAAGIYVHLPRDSEQTALHTMTFTAGDQKLYAGYFFIANGGAVPRAEQVRLLAFDLHSTYAYYLKLQFTSASVTSQEELAKYSASLLDDLFGDIMRCTPDWVKVEAGTYPPKESTPK